MMFAHRLVHDQFTVYANKTIPQEVLPLLDDAYRVVSHYELHDSDFRFKVFFAYGSSFNGFDDLQGRGPAARATAGNIIVKIPVNIGMNEAYTERSCINLTELLIHEMVHNLQANRYGFLMFNPWSHPPMWKLEGYPEYVARQNRRNESHELSSEVQRYLKLEKKSNDGWTEVVPGHHMPAVYYKGRLMVEYLIDVKGMTYDQILASDQNEEDIFEELRRWSEKRIPD